MDLGLVTSQPRVLSSMISAIKNSSKNSGPLLPTMPKMKAKFQTIVRATMPFLSVGARNKQFERERQHQQDSESMRVDSGCGPTGGDEDVGNGLLHFDERPHGGQRRYTTGHQGLRSLLSPLNRKKTTMSYLVSADREHKLPCSNTRTPGTGGEIQWQFSQVKGTLDDEVTEADIISCVEFNHDGELLATGDKGGRVVIFHCEQPQSSKRGGHGAGTPGEYTVYSTFQSHEPEFDYLKSLEIEERINKIRWLRRKNQAHFLLSTNDKTIKLWKVSERDKKIDGYNLPPEGPAPSLTDSSELKVPTIAPMELMVEASPRRVFANAHTYHINSISVNSDQETYLSADDLRINLWHLECTDQSFNIVDIKPANMEELTEVITAAEFHPHHCQHLVYSSSKGTLRLCDMRQAALCDQHSKLFEEPEDPTNRSFFSEIISSISDVKFSHCGRYLLSRDYLTVKVWDLQMENRPVQTFDVHEYLRTRLCSLYENDCIFDKFECCWNGNDNYIMTGSYNNFFRVFDRNTKRDVTLEASREIAKPRTLLRPKRVCATATGVGKRKKEELTVDCLDFNRKILHTAWHPRDNVLAVAATNNLYLFTERR